MTKYTFILLSKETEVFLEKIQGLGIVDITRSSKAVDSSSEEAFEKADGIKRLISALEKEDFAKDARYAELSGSLRTALDETESLRPWGRFDSGLISELSSSGAEIRFYHIPTKRFDPSWKNEIPLEIINEDRDGIFFVTAGDGINLPVVPCPTPEHSFEVPEMRAAELNILLEKRRQALIDKKNEIPSLKEEYTKVLAQLDRYLAGKSVIKASENMVDVITGFAPSEYNASLAKAFDEMGVFWMAQAANAQDNPPIKLRNNRFVKMFQVLTDMYGRPSYDGFDPTPFISIFFLLFFAFCMGDAGYGIILMLSGLALRKVRSFADLAPLVITLGAGTFIVGILFHTFFSIDIRGWDIIPAWLKSAMVPSKIAGYDGTMVLALAVGIIHLCLAMIVKTVNQTVNKGFSESLGTWGWTLLVVGGTAVGAVCLAGVLDTATARWIIIILGCLSALGIFIFNDIHRNPLKNIGSGLWDTYNTATGILGDVLSYLRLYALGLAGSMLGFAFNDLASKSLGDGGIGWVVFILIVVIGHTLNIAMAALGAFVHPLRLNFLEFFKNSGYEGTGRKYNPLKQ